MTATATANATKSPAMTGGKSASKAKYATTIKEKVVRMNGLPKEINSTDVTEADEDKKAKTMTITRSPREAEGKNENNETIKSKTVKTVNATSKETPGEATGDKH